MWMHSDLRLWLGLGRLTRREIRVPQLGERILRKDEVAGSILSRPPIFMRLRSKSATAISLSRDVADAVGQVPIVRLNRLGAPCRTHELYLKLESCNPGGSIKEKNAVYLIRQALESGQLRPGGTIIESSSGNFGIGLAMVGAALGYKVMIVVDPKTPPPMRRMLLAYGAQLVDVPGSEADAFGSVQGARMKKAEALAREIPGGWYVCQHLNPANPDAHFEYTAREIEAAFDVLPEVIVVGVSTAGQVTGLTRYFAERHPHVKFVAVDVAGSAILGTPRHAYKMTGLGLCFAPPVFDPGALAAAFSVTDQIAFSMCHLLARKEGLLLGASTGAIVAAGLACAGEKPKRILMINPDRGDRYLETVYNPEWLKAQDIEILEEAALLDAAMSLKPVPRDVLLRAQPV